MSGPRKLDNPARVKTKNYYLVWYETRYMGRQQIRQTMGKEFVNRNVKWRYSATILSLMLMQLGQEEVMSWKAVANT